MPTILITGSNRGIGLEMTRQYLTEGWKVLACCRDIEKSTALNQLKQQHPTQLTIATLDVRDADRIQSLSQEWRTESIDILLNNAGINEPWNLKFGELTVKHWQEILLVNTIAPLIMAQAFVEQVARSNRRIIATMSSFLGSIADNDSGSHYYYRSSKSAVNMAMKSLSIDLAPHKIISVMLHPGWVQTDMGGPGAPLSISESVMGLRKVLNLLDFSQTGRFLNYQGQELPW